MDSTIYSNVIFDFDTKYLGTLQRHLSKGFKFSTNGAYLFHKTNCNGFDRKGRTVSFIITDIKEPNSIFCKPKITYGPGLHRTGEHPRTTGDTKTMGPRASEDIDVLR